MPIYEYRCPFCDFKIELQQGMTENHKAQCPECGGEMYQLFTGITHRMSDKKRKKELTGWRKKVF